MKVAVVFTNADNGYYIEEVIVGDRIHSDDGINSWTVRKIVDETNGGNYKDVEKELSNPSIDYGTQFVVIQNTFDGE